MPNTSSRKTKANGPLNIKKLIILGEVYSPNLGDPVICDCLSYIFQLLEPDLLIEKRDISGRARLKAASTKPICLSTLPKFHYAIKPPPRIASLIKFPFRLLRDLTYLLSNRDACLLVFGGGQLVLDNNLRFPLDLLRFSLLSQVLNIPLSVHACGVGSHWTRLGKSILRLGFRIGNIRYISVRDIESQCTLRHLLTGINNVDIDVTIDPAVWAGSVYRYRDGSQFIAKCAASLPSMSEHRPINNSSSKPVIGLNLMADGFIRRGLDTGSVAYTRAELITFWKALIRYLLENKRYVVVFSNGAPADELFADEVMQTTIVACSQSLNCLTRERACMPSELVSIISRCNVVVAHRLHAAIIGFGLGVPVVSLEWDSKVGAFNRAVNRDGYMIKSSTLNPILVANMIDKALHLPASQSVSQLPLAKENILSSCQKLLSYIHK